MTRLERFLAQWLARRLVKQGAHKARLTAFFRVLQTTAEQEFTEDTASSCNTFLQECVVDAGRV